MDAKYFRTIIGALTTAGTRRGLVAVLSGWFLVPGLVGLGVDETDAKRRDRHQRRRKSRAKRKRRNETSHQPPSTPPPPAMPPPPSAPPPPPPLPVTRVDTECTADGPGILVLATENSRLAQTFTALASGPLVQADLNIAKPVGTGGDFVLRLSPVKKSGEVRLPTNDVLAETEVAETSVPEGSSIVTFNFATPFSVVAGVPYALVLTRPGGSTFAWVGSEVNPCSGGGFVSQDQTGAFLDITSDFFFTTFVTS